MRTVLICALALSGLIACTDKLAHKDSEPEGPSAAVATKTYSGVGTVRSLDPKLPAVEIEHEEIKGLMPAMQMDFHVQDKSLLEGLAVGDRIEFKVESGVGGLLIVAIRKV